MSQENKYRDTDKNVYDLPQPVIPQSDEYRYVSIGINSDGTFKTDVTITQTTPIWFISRLSYEDNSASSGFINLTNNSGVDLLIMIEVIERFYSYFTPFTIFSNDFFANAWSYGCLYSSNRQGYYNHSKYFFALRNNENMKDKPDDWVGYFFSMYYPVGIIYSRPLFVS